MRAVFQANDTVYTFLEANYLQTHIDSIDELRDAHVYGISIAAPDEKTAAEAAAEINALYGEEVTAFQNVTHVDVVPKGCSKGSGVEVVRKAFSIEEMYGIGDSFNDLPLLKSVDHPYTLTHAPQQVQEAAEGIVRGVSELLDRI
jgi:HAD superfamily hydrolase (TIGR01484 family)